MSLWTLASLRFFRRLALSSFGFAVIRLMKASPPWASSGALLRISFELFSRSLPRPDGPGWECCPPSAPAGDASLACRDSSPSPPRLALRKDSLLDGISHASALRASCSRPITNTAQKSCITVSTCCPRASPAEGGTIIM